jgi:hypothetical protein
MNTASLSSSLSCIVPVLIVVLVLGAIFFLFRRIIFLADEAALITLMFNGLREVLGPRRSSLGCLMIVGLAAGFVLFVVLLLLNAGTCFSPDHATDFCRLFPVLGQ